MEPVILPEALPDTGRVSHARSARKFLALIAALHCHSRTAADYRHRGRTAPRIAPVVKTIDDRSIQSVCSADRKA